MNQTITAEAIKEKIKEYQAKIAEWDAKIDTLAADSRIEFEKERDEFTKELREAYQDLAEAKLAEYAARVDGSYHKLRARWETFFAA